MNNRKLIKSQHELSLINEFIAFISNETGVEYILLERPEPPDALLKSENGSIWVEIADIYRSDDEAHEELSHVTPGEENFIHRENPIVEPDKRIADRLFNVLMKKISKSSYRNITSQLGKGILILNERDPLFNDRTLNYIHDLMVDVQNDLDLESDYFKEIYLSFRSGLGISFLKLMCFE